MTSSATSSATSSYTNPCENGGDLDDDIMPALCAADGENLIGEVADSGYEEESIKAVVVVFSRRAAGRAARYNNEVASSKDVSDVCLKPSPRRWRHGVIGLRTWRHNLHSVP